MAEDVLQAVVSGDKILSGTSGRDQNQMLLPFVVKRVARPLLQLRQLTAEKKSDQLRK